MQARVPIPGANPAALTPLDVAAGGPLGIEPREPLPAVPNHLARWDTFGSAVIPALTSSPCLVSFSGGRDSSGVLAATTVIARREGLPDPVPVTLRFARGSPPGAKDRQELVVRHLKLREWERIEVADELELTGPIAATALRRHGHIFPATAHLTLPAMERARGGALVVAVGGSDLFIYWRWLRVANVLAGRERPRLGDLRGLALAALPPAVRGAIARRKAPPAPGPWLRPHAAREISRIFAEEIGTEPVRFDRAIRTHIRHRCFSAAIRSLYALANGAGCALHLPTYHPEYLATLARDAGWAGFGDRELFMRALVGDLLPDEVLSGPEGHDYGEVYFGARLRAFAESWSGYGVDEALVDADVLRDMWRSGRRDMRTGLLIQAAWLHDQDRPGGPTSRLDRPSPMDQDLVSTE